MRKMGFDNIYVLVAGVLFFSAKAVVHVGGSSILFELKRISDW